MIRFIRTQKWLSAVVLTIAFFFAADIKAQTITTVAGGFGDDTTALTYARLFGPNYIAFDSSGNIYFTEFGHDRLRKINPAGKITTIIGTHSPWYHSFGDPYCAGSTAATATIYGPGYIMMDKNDNSFFAAGQLFKMTASGAITQLTAATSYSGDGSAATAAGTGYIYGVAVDRIGNIYIADGDNARIRKIDTSGIINTIAGTGVMGFSGDSGLAIYAKVYVPKSVAVDSVGNIYFSDDGNNKIRKIDTHGIITTAFDSTSGNLLFDHTGHLYLSTGTKIAKLSSSGAFVTVAGGGSRWGDGGPATGAVISVKGFAVSRRGEIVLTDYDDSVVRKIDTSGIIRTIAGNRLGYSGTCPDGDTAIFGVFNGFSGLYADHLGNLYFEENNTIRKITMPVGVVSTIAGTGTPGFSGDGGAATLAELQNPQGITSDRAGNIYIADYDNHHVRKISPSGIISTVAGGGASGLGDGGPATAAQVYPVGLTLDTAGNLYIADYDNRRLRKVNASTGIITTVAGGGSGSYSMSGISATSIDIGNPTSVAVDRKGNSYVTGTSYSYKINPAGFIFIVPVNGSLGIDSVGNLYASNGQVLDTNGYVHSVFGEGVVFTVTAAVTTVAPQAEETE